MRKRFISPFGIMVEILLLFLILGIWQVKNLAGLENKEDSVSVTAETGTETETETDTETDTDTETEEKDFIKWVEFNVTYGALNRAYTYDVDTYMEEIHLNWVDLLAYLGAKYGGDFTRYREKDMTEAAEKILAGDTTIEELTADMQYYGYYREAYGAVLDGLVGVYEIEKPAEEGSDEKVWKKCYGLKAFGPVAKGYPYSEFDDFGVSRSYGYRRNHLGHDMMGQVGTPITAIESGYVEVLGWNQYGGWRIGIRSFDGRRYYYYAHLRQNFPFNKSLEEGSAVTAGDVIGYMGHTGYSTKENVNNIKQTHLHWGLQLIFDESQKEGNSEIWVDCYALTRFLSQNRSETWKEVETKEYHRTYEMKDPAVEAYLKDKKE